MCFFVLCMCVCTYVIYVCVYACMYVRVLFEHASVGTFATIACVNCICTEVRGMNGLYVRKPLSARNVRHEILYKYTFISDINFINVHSYIYMYIYTCTHNAHSHFHILYISYLNIHSHIHILYKSYLNIHPYIVYILFQYTFISYLNLI